MRHDTRSESSRPFAGKARPDPGGEKGCIAPLLVPENILEQPALALHFFINRDTGKLGHSVEACLAMRCQQCRVEPANAPTY